jgi:hypothetical protein
MYFAHRCIRAATAFLIVWTSSWGMALPKAVSTAGGTSPSFLLTHLPPAANRCGKSAANAVAVPRRCGRSRRRTFLVWPAAHANASAEPM